MNEGKFFLDSSFFPIFLFFFFSSFCGGFTWFVRDLEKGKDKEKNIMNKKRLIEISSWWKRKWTQRMEKKTQKKRLIFICDFFSFSFGIEDKSKKVTKNEKKKLKRNSFSRLDILFFSFNFLSSSSWGKKELINIPHEQLVLINKRQLKRWRKREVTIKFSLRNREKKSCFCNFLRRHSKGYLSLTSSTEGLLFE